MTFCLDSMRLPIYTETWANTLQLSYKRIVRRKEDTWYYMASFHVGKGTKELWKGYKTGHKIPRKRVRERIWGREKEREIERGEEKERNREASVIDLASYTQRSANACIWAVLNLFSTLNRWALRDSRSLTSRYNASSKRILRFLLKVK